MSESKKFRLLIKPNYFVPNIADKFSDSRRVHVFWYGKCNYRCEFCSFGKWRVDTYPEETPESFEMKIWDMMRSSKNFKFTGGEPTLNPYLPELMRITKIYGATNFLDTNGSAPEKVRALISEGLVDIVGISLKGLNPEEALSTAAIRNRKLCWDNVFDTIDICAQAEGVQLIITYVACDGYFDEAGLDKLASMLRPYPGITLKINNCYLSERVDFKRTGFEHEKIYSMVEAFVERNPDYKGRTVLFRDHIACLEEDKVVLF